MKKTFRAFEKIAANDVPQTLSGGLPFTLLSLICCRLERAAREGIAKEGGTPYGDVLVSAEFKGTPPEVHVAIDMEFEVQS